VVVSLSRYKYGNSYKNLANEPSCCGRSCLDYDELAEEVDSLRYSVDRINDLLFDISDMSNEVMEQISYLENSLEAIEEQL
jgi:hypothetical protein